jgi:hypothetical protein
MEFCDQKLLGGFLDWFLKFIFTLKTFGTFHQSQSINKQDWFRQVLKAAHPFI